MGKKVMKRWFTVLLAILTALPMLLSLALPVIAADTAKTTFDPTPYKNIIKTVGAPELRLTSPGGIRFVNKVEVAAYKELMGLIRDRTASNIKVGTLIAPVAYVEQAGAFTVEALDKLPHGVNYVKVETKINQWYNNDNGDDGYYEFAGSLTNIKAGHAFISFAGIGYIEVVLNSGESVYIYGNYAARGASMFSLAKSRLENPRGLTAGQIEYLNGYQLTATTYSSSSMNNVSQIGNRLYFTVGNTTSFLTYTGDNGWRIKSHHTNRIGAEPLGAAQAMAFYLEEDSTDHELPITVTESDDGGLRVTSSDGTYVEFSYRGFSMSFYSTTGRRVAQVSGIEADGRNVTLSGILSDNEAVYGGGERLDTVNKRGTTMDLYTCDGWNNSKTSYTVIPLFTTTRGAGIFINRYERMIADFGDKMTSTWEIELENEISDFYIFANDDIKDSIENYTKLSGASALPEEWAYGHVFIRYRTDLNSFDGKHAYENAADIPNVDKIQASKNGTKLLEWLAAGNKPSHLQVFYEGATPKYIYLKDEEYPNGAYVCANLESAPSGRSVKHLVTKMIEAGMKPAAVCMEPWAWGSFDVMKIEELREACEWLDTLDIKAMLYMRVASLIYKSMPGYDPDYLLKAWVTTNGVTQYTTNIPDVAYNGANPDAGKVGGTHQYVDITNPAAMEWYLDTVWGKLLKVGIDGVKIDFCETFPDEYKSYGVGSSTTSVKYDWKDPSKIISGTEHHAYPTYFITAFFNRMNELKKEMGLNDGFFVSSRGGGIGSQRNPYMWAGDQVRNFNKLADQIMAVINSGLSGIPFMSYDMAGYRYGGGGTTYANANSQKYESDVFARAIAFTIFMPNIQTNGTVRSAFELTEEAQEITRNFLAFREKLKPYLNKLVAEACTTGLPVSRHPVLHYQDDANVYNLKTQFMMGDGLMVAPILNATDTTVDVYLPAGSWTNLLTGEVIAGGQTVTATASYGQIPVFLNKDSADAEMLREIFAGDEWKAIQNWK